MKKNEKIFPNLGYFLFSEDKPRVTYVVMEPAEILNAVTNFADHERHVVSDEDMVIYEFPATSATGERAFAMPRRVKTWLQADTNHQRRLNHVALLQTNKTSKDKIWLVDEANEVA